MCQKSVIVKTLKTEDDEEITRIGHTKLNERTDESAMLGYLLQKEAIQTLDIKEELIFFPELYGICPTFYHQNCLSLRRNRSLRKRVEKYIKRTTHPSKRVPILKYIHEYNFVEIYLDNLQLRHRIPLKIFRCQNLKILSLRGNNMKNLPADIGRLKKLEILYLSNNRLRANTLPYSLTFCKKLHTLFLDNNKIAALPGFLLEMENLFTLRRPRLVSSFRRMFLIQKFPRIEKVTVLEQNNNPIAKEVISLEKLAAKVIIVNKIDYFSPENFSTIIQDLISRIYPDCLICENCNTIKFDEAGYMVSTSRYGYLGNYWSIFSHQACGKNCAEKLFEKSYKMEQVSYEKLEKEYDRIKQSQENNHRESKQCCTIL